jgi:hypothetical protein
VIDNTDRGPVKGGVDMQASLKLSEESAGYGEKKIGAKGRDVIDRIFPADAFRNF